VTTAMRAAGTIGSDVEVVGLRLDELGNGGVGLSGETVRVTLTYRGTDDALAGLPESVIAKFPTREAANRGMIETYDCYAREIHFYRDLAAEVPLRIPRHYGSDFDPARFRRANDAAARMVDRLPTRAHLALTRDVTKFMRPTKRRYALLLEDMGPSMTVHDLVDPPPRARLEQILDALAELHATFWGRHDLADHPVSRPLVSTMPGTFVNVMRARNKPLAEQRWADWLTPADVAMFDTAGDRFVADLATVNTPMTFVHGDPRSDNILFDGGDPILLDWAQPGFAHPGFDVGYVLGSSLRIAESSDIGALVARYGDRLSERGVDLDPAVLAAGIGAAARSMIVQQLNSLTVLIGDYGEAGLPTDIWTPRLLAVAHAYQD